MLTHLGNNLSPEMAKTKMLTLDSMQPYIEKMEHIFDLSSHGKRYRGAHRLDPILSPKYEDAREGTVKFVSCFLEKIFTAVLASPKIGISEMAVLENDGHLHYSLVISQDARDTMAEAADVILGFLSIIPLAPSPPSCSRPSIAFSCSLCKQPGIFVALVQSDAFGRSSKAVEEMRAERVRKGLRLLCGHIVHQKCMESAVPDVQECIQKTRR